MPDADQSDTRFSLRRWSRRKLAAARVGEPSAPPAAPVAAPATVGGGSTTAVRMAEGTATAPQPAPELPAIDSLTFESDFSAFLQPGVDASLRRQALKKLFSDPRFNIMDGLDVYIDDYGKPDPIDPDVVRQLVQSRYLFSPPQTRVNEDGVAEDVPAETEVASAAGAGAAPVRSAQANAGAADGDSPPASPTGPAAPLPETPEP